MNVAEVSEESVRARLRTEDPEFQRLEQEHRQLDQKLLTFETHVYLSPEEEKARMISLPFVFFQPAKCRDPSPWSAWGGIFLLTHSLYVC